MANKMPHITSDEKGIQTLYVDGNPYMALAGELHNSSSSSLEFMEEKVWPCINGMHLNTVILPVYWENIEPIEGQFDFSLTDGLLFQARRENVKLVILWFGLWKNGESFYVPGWIKRDYKRFFHACYSTENPSNTISPLCREAVEADAKAFSALMKHLRETDNEDHTVIMVQVENEIGFLGAERDYSPAAQKAYAQNVPETIVSCYGCRGSWKEALGENAPEIFMAYHYSLAVETIASSGKAEYPLPMYVNAWLEQFPARPGVYPSGGPIAKLMPLWKKISPSIDLLAPDIYLSDFAAVCAEYTQYGNPLFIPEARRDPVSASNIFYAFGQYNAMCFSPFAIEEFMEEQIHKPDEQLTATLNIDWDAFSCLGTGAYIVHSYEILQNMKDLLFRYRGTEQLQSFIRKSCHDRGCILPLSNCDLQLTYQDGAAKKPGAAGIVIEESPDCFWVIGCNVKIKVLPKMGSDTFITVISMQEGQFEDSIWKCGRILNGDEQNHPSLGEMADVLKFEVCLHK